MSAGSPLTFLFSDIESSTRHWETEPDAMAAALRIHDELMRSAVGRHGGRVFKHTGDGMCAVFDTPDAAVRAAVDAQRDLSAQVWPVADPIRVRMGAHLGEAIATSDDYFGPVLSRTSRVMSAGSGGQILVTAVVATSIDLTSEGVSFIDRGEHALRDLNGVEQLYQVSASGIGDDFPPLRVLSAYRHNLPTRSSSLVGRATDVETLTGLVRSRRLVTLTGPGGCGKSSLALRVAGDLLPDFPGGVWLADLTSLEDGRFVARVLASALGHEERLLGDSEADQQGILRQLVRLVGDGEVLVVVDNCEHVVDAAAVSIATLLPGCPGLRVIATSRETLRIDGEQVFPVHPLALPSSADASVEDVLGSASGELFAARARAVSPDFVIDARNAASIASICRRLDGLPLGIELAAARVRVMSTGEIDARLADSLRLLRSGERAADPRHRTLTAALEWSHDLLSPIEAAVLRRLSVFSDGFTIEAAERVCVGDPVDEFDVLDSLTSLVDRSLVTRIEGLARFRLLEVVRQFEDRRLDSAGEKAETRQRHFAWALELAQRAAPVEHISGTEQLAREASNMRAAMGAAEDANSVTGDERLLLAYTLWRYMLESGRIPEGLEWLNVALRSDHTSGTVTEARALDAAGFLSSLRGDFLEARVRVQRSLELCRELGDELSTGWVLLRYGLVCGVQGAVDDSSSPFIEAIDIFERHGYQDGLLWARLELGRAMFASDRIDVAERHFADALRAEMATDVSALRYAEVAAAACRLGEGEHRLVQLAAATAELEDLGMLYTSTQGLLISCAAALDAQAFDDAADYAGRALAITHRSGGVTQSLHALEWAAIALAGRGDVDSAVPLWDYVEAERERLGSIVPAIVARLEHSIAGPLRAACIARREAGESAAEATPTLDQVVRLARAATAGTAVAAR